MPKKEQSSGLDPDIANFIRALARDTAREDHEKAQNVCGPDDSRELPPGSPKRIHAELTVSDGQGKRRVLGRGSRLEKWTEFEKTASAIADDFRSGRIDERSFWDQIKALGRPDNK